MSAQWLVLTHVTRHSAPWLVVSTAIAPNLHYTFNCADLIYWSGIQYMQNQRRDTLLWLIDAIVWEGFQGTIPGQPLGPLPPRQFPPQTIPTLTILPHTFQTAQFLSFYRDNLCVGKFSCSGIAVMGTVQVGNFWRVGGRGGGRLSSHGLKGSQSPSILNNKLLLSTSMTKPF